MPSAARSAGGARRPGLGKGVERKRRRRPSEQSASLAAAGEILQRRRSEKHRGECELEIVFYLCLRLCSIRLVIACSWASWKHWSTASRRLLSRHPWSRSRALHSALQCWRTSTRWPNRCNTTASSELSASGTAQTPARCSISWLMALRRSPSSMTVSYVFLVVSRFCRCPFCTVGWFGKGIYFTSSAKYAMRYCSTPRVLVLCYALLLNPYPLVADDAPAGKEPEQFALFGRGNYKHYQVCLCVVSRFDFVYCSVTMFACRRLSPCRRWISAPPLVCSCLLVCTCWLMLFALCRPVDCDVRRAGGFPGSLHSAANCRPPNLIKSNHQPRTIYCFKTVFHQHLMY